VSGEFAFRPRRQRRRASLNLTSLIDVLFLLLIFFMLTSTFRRSGEMKLELPSSSTSNPSVASDQRDFIEVVLTEEGQLFVNDEPVTSEQAPQVLRRLHLENPEWSVRLKAAADCRHADVVRLYDLVRETGFPGFSLGTEILAPGGRRSAGNEGSHE